MSEYLVHIVPGSPFSRAVLDEVLPPYRARWGMSTEWDAPNSRVSWTNSCATQRRSSLQGRQIAGERES